MKKNTVLLLFLILATLGASTWFVAGNDLIGKVFNDDDPDRSPTGNEISREEFILRRNEHLDLLRGYDTAQQESRTDAIREMERSEQELRANRGVSEQPEASWVPLGPSPIPINGSTSYSGRVSAIAVHPTNPDIVYLGTAQGGLYRSLNGGTTWTPLMDSALTLAIGAIAISPSDPTTVFVGTGESTLCNSGCFIGVGLYRITNADTNPILSDVLNKNDANADVFTGRAISEILVHPTDSNIIFVSSTSGIAGIGSSTLGLTLPTLGVYRCTNAMSATPTFELLNMGISERSVTDLVMEPDNPNHIIAGVLGDATTGGGGLYATFNALSPAPTFTQVLSTSLTGRNSRVELAAAKVNGIVTVYAASGQGNGTVYVSPDSGPFTQVSNNGFCNPQCFYDIAIAVDPTNASKVYLGGSPTLPFGRSTNGGTSFSNSSSGLHVDTQVITVAPSNPNIVYFGSDGGVWRTTNVSATPIVWTTLNNSTLSATQFMSLAIHPIDRNYSLGGTQDNGTEFFAPDGIQWIQSDGGDGGFAVIDQTSPNTTNIVAYHTYYNSSGSQIGFTRATSTVPPGDPNWGSFLGCGGTANGINCADSTLFYAPMVGGPNAAGSTGNTLYFGTDHLYRSISQGTTMTDVSGALPSRISAIAIAPQDDNIRLVGLAGTPVANFGVYLSTTAGATTMTNVTGPIPGRYVGRIAIDPANSNVAYVCLNGFGLPSGQHVWKTTNLLSGSPTWTAAGNGIPDTPVDSLAIDPADSNTLFAGTDIGVFRSSDGGANWIPFSNGLPRVAVFGMAIQSSHRVLRISTHGRGMWDYDLSAAGPTPTPSSTSTNTPTPTQTQTPFPELDLTISQADSPDPVVVGHQLTYTLTVTNSPAALGGFACPHVRFDYPLGVPFTFVTATGTNGFNPLPDAGGVTWISGCLSSLGGVPMSATLTVVITPQVAGTLTSFGSSAVVDPDNLIPESDEANNMAQTITTTVVSETTGVAGTVTYGNTAAPPKFVSNALVTGMGSPNVTTTTGLMGPMAGQYDLTGFGPGDYTVSVSKAVGVGANGITSNDAARIAQHVAGVAPLTTDIQRVTADTSNNGTISSNDAALLARYVAGVGPPVGMTGAWRFFVPPGPTFPVGASPTSYTYVGPITGISGQDFVAVLGGEVTGNWTPTDARPANGPERRRSTDVRLPSVTVPADGEVLIPVWIEGVDNKGIISYQFDLRYDPSVLEPRSDAADVAGTASRGLSVVINPEQAGLLRVVAYGPYPIDGNALLMNLKFRSVGTPGSVSPLIWENFMFNEGDPAATATDGQVKLCAASGEGMSRGPRHRSNDPRRYDRRTINRSGERK